MDKKLKKFFINGVEVDAVKNLIVRDGEKIDISPKQVRILQCLVQSGGAIVTYDELEKTISDEQPGSHGTTLYQHIASLRKALGDSTSNPTFIKTISKQGYQFVGDYRPSAKPAWGEGRKTLLAAGVIFSAAATLLVLWAAGVFSSGSEALSSYERMVVDITDKLKYPQKVVGLQHVDQIRTDQYRLLQNAIEITAKYHLEQRSDLHVSVIPEFDSADTYKKLYQHFSKHSQFEYILQPAIRTEEDRAFVELNLLDPVGNQTRNLLQLDITGKASGLALSEFERELLRQLKELSLTADQQEQQLTSLESAKLVVEACDVRLNEFNHWKKLEQSIEKADLLIRQDPGNMIAYNILWENIFSLLDQQSKYNIDEDLNLLKEHSEKALALYPEHFKPHHAYAEYYCRTQDYMPCMQNLSIAMDKKSYDAGVLFALRFNFWQVGKSPVDVTTFNYWANPFTPPVLDHYRNDLLDDGRIHDTIELLNYHAQWRTVRRDWNLLGRISTEYERLQEFADWYARHYSQTRLNVLPELSLPEEQLPSRYISYMLLNANQLELARYWVAYGKEGNLPYFDLKVIDLLSYLWEGKWNDDKWREARDFAMARREFQNTMDKLSIAYFDFYVGAFTSSGKYIEELYPQFSEENFKITTDNFRFAVYYNEIKKKLGDYRRVISIEHALRNFLKTTPSTPERDVYFGLADVEFYALNNDRDKAMQILEHAVNEQNWLPNSFWLWPPIEHNRFLVGLQQYPEFHTLVANTRLKLAKLCFQANCPD